MKRALLSLVILMLFIGVASAIPTTGAATAIGINNATLNGAGVSGGIGWFLFGTQPGSSWTSLPNVTASGGAITYTMNGATTESLFNSQTYYYRACDATGCGSELSFTLLTPTPMPTTTYGQWATNITQNGFNPMNLVWNAIQPYVQVTGLTIFWMLILAMVFIGIWIRTRGTSTATVLGIICAGLAFSSAAGLQIGVPPEFTALAQAVLYISIAGAVTSFTFK